MTTVPILSTLSGELLPCPFCGGDKLTIESGPDECRDDTGTQFVYAVFCAGNEGRCGCGPSAIDSDSAIKAWNRRALSPAERGGG